MILSLSILDGGGGAVFLLTSCRDKMDCSGDLLWELSESLGWDGDTC